MNKVILYIATSQDGFIADKKGSVDWLPQPASEDDLENVGYFCLMDRIDTIVMGSKSYQQILGFGQWGWPDKQSYVFTLQQLTPDLPCVHTTHVSPKVFLANHSSKTGKDIWLLGGAELIKSFAKECLIDEILLTITPLKLSEGIPLDIDLNGFDLIDEKPLMDGMIQRQFKR